MPGKSARQKGDIMDDLEKVTRDACISALLRSLEPSPLIKLLDPGPHPQPTWWQITRYRWRTRVDRLRDAWLVLRGHLDVRYPDGW